MRLVGVAWQSCQLGCSCGEDVRSSAASSTLRFPGRAKGFKGFPSNGFLTLLPPSPSPPLLLHPPPEWKSTKTQYWAQRPSKAVQAAAAFVIAGNTISSRLLFLEYY